MDPMDTAANLDDQLRLLNVLTATPRDAQIASNAGNAGINSANQSNTCYYDAPLRLSRASAPIAKSNHRSSFSTSSCSTTTTGSVSPTIEDIVSELPFELEATSIARPRTTRRKGIRMNRDERRKRNREAAERTRKRKAERMERMEGIIKALYRQNQELKQALNITMQNSEALQAARNNALTSTVIPTTACMGVDQIISSVGMNLPQYPTQNDSNAFQNYHYNFNAPGKIACSTN